MRSTRFRLHVGIEGGKEEGGEWGERGRGRESGCKSFAGSGRTRFCWCDCLAFQTGQLDTGARPTLHYLQVTLQITLLSSTPTLRSRPSHRLLKVPARRLIIKYFLDNRIAASHFMRGTCADNGRDYLLLFKLR